MYWSTCRNGRTVETGRLILETLSFKREEWGPFIPKRVQKLGNVATIESTVALLLESTRVQGGCTTWAGNSLCRALQTLLFQKVSRKLPTRILPVALVRVALLAKDVEVAYGPRS